MHLLLNGTGKRYGDVSGKQSEIQLTSVASILPREHLHPPFGETAKSTYNHTRFIHGCGI